MYSHHPELKTHTHTLPVPELAKGQPCPWALAAHGCEQTKTKEVVQMREHNWKSDKADRAAG
jgi:hypothetical protein